MFVLWLLIVVVLAMGVAMFAAYARDLNHRLDRAQAGAEARGEDLATLLDDLRARQAELVERVQNLEAIVTSEAWEARKEADAPEEAPSDQARAARIARRLR